MVLEQQQGNNLMTADWIPLKSALSLSSEDIQKFAFLGFVICHSGERIYIYKDTYTQRRIYVDHSGNFHCGFCVFPHC